MRTITTLPEKGELVIVYYQQREVDQLPFALAEVRSVDLGTKSFTVWWYGNNSENIFAAQRKGYWQPSTNKHYFDDKPIHSSHPKYTSVTTETVLGVKDILVGNVELGYELNIPFDVLFQISEDPRVSWSIKQAASLKGLEDILERLK